MVLRMSSPQKRPGSDNWYYRRRIPAKVRTALAKLPKSQRPNGWFKDDIWISLRTADRATAKVKWSDVAAEVEKTIAALLSGPAPLDHIQINSLSGELYKAFAQGLERNPILTPEQWLRVAEMNEEARQGRYGTGARLGIHKTPEARRRASMEARFGKMTDAFLVERGIVTDLESRWSLIERASIDLSKAAEKLARNADFDYRPDPWAERFTPFEASASDAENTSLTALAEEWHTDALARGVRKRDAKRIKSSFERLIKFLKHDDVRRVTQQDILRWRADRYALGLSRKTIDDSDIASFKNVFNYAVGLNRIAVNPTDGTAEKGRKNKGRKVVREDFFTEEEARDILLHAAAVTGSRKENPKTTAAKRWVPWLCAYRSPSKGGGQQSNQHRSRDGAVDRPDRRDERRRKEPRSRDRAA